MECLATEIGKHLEFLVNRIGARPSGSSANHAAADYIQQVFRAAGLVVEEQRFDCMAWAHDETCLELNGQTVEAAANAYSPACDVTDSLVTASSVAELETAELNGHIALLYGELTKTPLAAKSWFLKDERDTRIVALLEQKAPAAILTVQANGDLPRLIEDTEFDIPSATVSARVGQQLVRAKAASPVHLRIKTQRTGGYSANIVGRTASHAGGEHTTRIVLCAHYDSKIDTPGAQDNGSGTAILLALAQELSRRKLAHGLEFVAFTNEEYLPMGDDEYVRRGEAGFGQILTCINIDGVGQMLGTNTVMATACSSAFEAHILDVARRYPGVVRAEPWPESNHSTFSWRGVPSVAFTAIGGPNVVHQRCDTLDGLSPEKLNEVAALAVDIVQSLQDKSVSWCKT